MFVENKHKVNFLVLIVTVVMKAKACVAHESKPPDNNKICQDALGAVFVWDEHIEKCVECTSCTPKAQDPHCVTCRELKIIPSSGDTTPQLDVRSSTPLPPSSTMTNSSPSGMSSTSQTNVTNDDNKGSEAQVVALWIVLPCLGVFSIVVLILLCWKFKCKIKAPPMPQPHEQETEPPADSHPMIDLSTDGSRNQAAEAV